MALFGPDGVLMVDTENRQVAEKTLKAIRSFTNAPIKVLVNTHIHSDHTGANAFFAQQGAVIFSQEDLQSEMLRPPPRANGQPAPAPEMAGVPVGTYRYNPAAPGQPAVTFNMNGETVDFIPMMPSHTAGDTIVRFRKANVIYIEDFYRNFGYPFADQANGGSVRGMLDAIDLIEKLAGPDTTLVPGHGTLIKKNDLRPYRAMLVDILAKVKTTARSGQVADGGAGREADGAVRQDDSGRHAAEQGSLHHRGLRRSEGLSARRGRQADNADASLRRRPCPHHLASPRSR